MFEWGAGDEDDGIVVVTTPPPHLLIPVASLNRLTPVASLKPVAFEPKLRCEVAEGLSNCCSERCAPPARLPRSSESLERLSREASGPRWEPKSGVVAGEGGGEAGG